MCTKTKLQHFLPCSASPITHQSNHSLCCHRATCVFLFDHCLDRTPFPSRKVTKTINQPSWLAGILLTYSTRLLKHYYYYYHHYTTTTITSAPSISATSALLLMGDWLKGIHFWRRILSPCVLASDRSRLNSILAALYLWMHWRQREKNWTVWLDEGPRVKS